MMPPRGRETGSRLSMNKGEEGRKDKNVRSGRKAGLGLEKNTYH